MTTSLKVQCTHSMKMQLYNEMKQQDVESITAQHDHTAIGHAVCIEDGTTSAKQRHQGHSAFNKMAPTQDPPTCAFLLPAWLLSRCERCWSARSQSRSVGFAACPVVYSCVRMCICMCVCLVCVCMCVRGQSCLCLKPLLRYSRECETIRLCYEILTKR